MKLYTLAVVTLMLVAGCSSSDDDDNAPVVNDPVTPSSDGTTISVINYESVLTDVLFFANAEYSNDTRQITRQLLDQNGFGERRESSDDFTYLRSDFVADPVEMMTTETRIFECTLGGGFSAVVNTSSSSGTTSIGNLDNCAIDDGRIDGEFSSNGFSSAEYTNIRVDKDSRALQAVGISYFERPADVQRGKAWDVKLSDGTYTSESGVVTTIENAKLALSESITDATFSTEIGLSYSSPVTNNKKVSLSTLSPMTTPSDGSEQYYSRGVFRIEATDGSAIELNADNGDIATFTATVTESGTTSSFVLPWSDIHRVRCFNAQSNQPLTRFSCN